MKVTLVRSTASFRCGSSPVTSGSIHVRGNPLRRNFPPAVEGLIHGSQDGGSPGFTLRETILSVQQGAFAERAIQAAARRLGEVSLPLQASWRISAGVFLVESRALSHHAVLLASDKNNGAGERVCIKRYTVFAF